MDSTYEMVKELIDFNSEGVDTYNHNGSTWLIFTDQKKWVIELTKEKTLWYNYYFFTGVFKYLSLDVVENQHYITKWVEDTVINGVKSTKGEYYKEIQKVEYTIQNGVKRTIADDIRRGWPIIEDTIENGVKETKLGAPDNRDYFIEDAIQNGVKKTKRSYEGSRKQRTKDTIQNGVKVTYSDKIPHEYDWTEQFTEEIDDIIQNGVKHTEKSLQIDGSCVIEDVINEGVKHTEYGDWEDGDERLDDIIKNGVKETTPGGYLGSVEMKGKIVHQFEHSKQDDDVKDVIKNGIKKTEAAALFDEESKMDTVISNGIKETHDDAYHHTGRVGGVIKNGVKQCIPSRTPLYNPMDFSVQYRENHRLDDVASVLEKGIKEVQPLPSQEGNMDWGNYYYRQGVPTKPHTQYVNDVITNGIKKTKAMDEWVNTDRIVDGIISGGVKKSPI
jgi:predicted peroxiredoxin